MTHGPRIDVDIGIYFSIGTVKPRCSKSIPMEALVSPFSKELTTPPVRNMCLAGAGMMMTDFTAATLFEVANVIV